MKTTDSLKLFDRLRPGFVADTPGTCTRVPRVHGRIGGYLKEARNVAAWIYAIN
ncbi:MAG: hypothetical protein WBM41_02560 [Arenicellales bacterium]